MRILSGAAAEARVRKLAARGSRYAEVEPSVRKIVDDIRRNGDRALRTVCKTVGRLIFRQAPLQVPELEIDTAWKSARALN